MTRCGVCGRPVRRSRARRPSMWWVNHAVNCSERGQYVPRKQLVLDQAEQSEQKGGTT